MLECHSSDVMKPGLIPPEVDQYLSGEPYIVLCAACHWANLLWGFMPYVER